MTRSRARRPPSPARRPLSPRGTQAEQNAQLAGQQANLAIQTIQSLITATTDTLQGAGLYDIGQALLQVALQNVDNVAGGFSASMSKEVTAMAAISALGDIYRKLGQWEKASRQYLKALRHRQRAGHTQEGERRLEAEPRAAVFETRLGRPGSESGTCRPRATIFRNRWRYSRTSTSTPCSPTSRSPR
jgi:tetratricopeptide (TPR) repeat protein